MKNLIIFRTCKEEQRDVITDLKANSTKISGQSSDAKRYSVIIIGATSGIGEALARLYTEKEYIVGITGRREERLRKLKQELGASCFIQKMDVAQVEQAVDAFHKLIKEMGVTPDVVILNAGIGNNNRKYELSTELETIDINIRGFTALAQTAYHMMKENGHGTLAGVSSVASYFGYGKAAAYNASKSYVSRYLSGIRHKARLDDWRLHVVDLRPGFIETQMIEDRPAFWVISADKCAESMYKAICKGKKVAHVPARWFWIGLIARLVPDSIIQRLG